MMDIQDRIALNANTCAQIAVAAAILALVNTIQDQGDHVTNPLTRRYTEEAEEELNRAQSIWSGK